MTNLRNFTYKDISLLKAHGYESCSYEEIRNLIDTWNKKLYNGSFFEMFAITNCNEIVGYASLYQQSKSIISCGIEIYPDYQRKGFATTSYTHLLMIAKDYGYKVAMAQVRVDNLASINLHKKLGFESDNYEYINKKGNEVYIFIKSL